MVCWDLKVGTSTIRTFNAFSIKGFFKFQCLSFAGSSLHHILEKCIFMLCSMPFSSLTFVGGAKVYSYMILCFH